MINGLLPRFIPKGFNISRISDEKISEIENYLNTLQRKILDWQTSEEFFNDCIISSCFYIRDLCMVKSCFFFLAVLRFTLCF